MPHGGGRGGPAPGVYAGGGGRGSRRAGAGGAPHAAKNPR